MHRVLIMLFVFIPCLSHAQLEDDSWYLTARGGILSTTLYNDDDFTRFGNSTANSWFSTPDFEMLSLNSGYYGLIVGRVLNEYLALESGIYTYRLKQSYERSGKLPNHSGIERDHITTLKFLRLPLYLRISFDFTQTNFLYVYGGLSVGYLYDYYDYSLTVDELSGRRTFEQKIENGSFEFTAYDLAHQRIVEYETGNVSGLYNEYSLSAVGGIGFEFPLGSRLHAQVFARSEIDLSKIEDHDAVYKFSDGTTEAIWDAEVRYPEKSATVGPLENRIRTVPFSFGFGLGVVFMFDK